MSDKVYRSTATGTTPEANPDGTCTTTGLAVSTDGTWRIHNFIEVHCPRALNDCSACHLKGSVAIPDPTRAVAVTFAPGAAVGLPERPADADRRHPVAT